MLHRAGSAPSAPPRLVERGRTALLAARSRRVRPARDDKQLAAWNGLALRALGHAALVLDEPRYASATRALVAFIETQLVREGDRLWRTARDGRAHTPAFCEDYLAIADGLLTRTPRSASRRPCSLPDAWWRRPLREFWDAEAGTFVDTSSEHERTVAQPRGLVDNATPSANSLGADVLQRLALLTGDETLAAGQDPSCARWLLPSSDSRAPSAECSARPIGCSASRSTWWWPATSSQMLLARSADAAAAPYAPDLVLTGVADTDHARQLAALRRQGCPRRPRDRLRLPRVRLRRADHRPGATAKRRCRGWRRPPSREEGQLHRPARVVGVRVEQRDRLPGAERHASADDRHGERRRREQRQHVIGAVAGTAVAVAPSVIVRKQPLQRRQQVRIRAGAELDHHDAGRGVRNEDGEQAILRPLLGEERGAGTVRSARVGSPPGLDCQLAGLHRSHGAA